MKKTADYADMCALRFMGVHDIAKMTFAPQRENVVNNNIRMSLKPYLFVSLCSLCPLWLNFFWISKELSHKGHKEHKKTELGKIDFVMTEVAFSSYPRKR
jgi:hypothetical protein